MRRPISVIVFAIINLVFTGFGLLATIYGMAIWFGLLLDPNANNPAMQAMSENEVFVAYQNVMLFVSIGVSIVVIAASIAMLQMKPWGRVVTILWGVYSIIFTIAGAVLQHVWVFKPMMQEVTEEPMKLGLQIGIIAGYIFAALFVVYYILMIAMLSRTKVKEAFEPQPDDLIQESVI